jgi:hypothetical protein
MKLIGLISLSVLFPEHIYILVGWWIGCSVVLFWIRVGNTLCRFLVFLPVLCTFQYIFLTTWIQVGLFFYPPMRMTRQYFTHLKHCFADRIIISFKTRRHCLIVLESGIAHVYLKLGPSNPNPRNLGFILWMLHVLSCTIILFYPLSIPCFSCFSAHFSVLHFLFPVCPLLYSRVPHSPIPRLSRFSFVYYLPLLTPFLILFSSAHFTGSSTVQSSETERGQHYRKSFKIYC